MFENKVQRVKVSEEVDEARIQIPKLTLADVTKTYDHYAGELRKLDASIQKANWQFDVDYAEVAAPGNSTAS